MNEITSIVGIDVSKRKLDLTPSSWVEPKELAPAERRKLAEEDFEYWVKKAKRMHDVYEYCLGKGNLNEVAFMLHQTAEYL